MNRKKLCIILSFLFIYINLFASENELVIRVSNNLSNFQSENEITKINMDNIYYKFIQQITTCTQITIRDYSTDSESRELQKQSHLEAVYGFVQDDDVYAIDKGARAELLLKFDIILVNSNQYKMSIKISEIETMKIITADTSKVFFSNQIDGTNIIEDFANSILITLEKRGYIKLNKKNEVKNPKSENEKKHFFAINITPKLGLMNGIVREYVIDPECTNTGNKESQLDWDIKNIPVISADADFWFFKYFYANLNFRSGFPKSSGEMQDYDWLNSITTAWLEDDPTELTNYSISDNQLDSYYSFGLKLGGSINLPLRIKILPFISFEYDYLSMSSYGGYALYKQYNWNAKYFVDSDGNAIKVISYQQEYNAFILGLKVQSEAIPRTYISAEYMISPYTTDITALDIHAIRFTGFLDKMPKSMMMKASAEIMYKINQLHRVGLSAFIHYIPFTSGPDYMAKVNANGKAYTSYQSTGVDGGTDRFLWQVSLVYQFSL